MKINTHHLLFSNTKLIKSLSVILFIYFSGTIAHHSLRMYYEKQDKINIELCDFPLAESESSTESDSHHKNTIDNSEEFIAVDKSDYSLFLIENSLIFHIRNSSLNGRIKEFPTPPPKHHTFSI